LNLNIFQNFKINISANIHLFLYPVDHVIQKTLNIFIFQSVDGKYDGTLMTKATLYFNGSVHWEPPAIYKSSCTINVEFFPFDQQHCLMKVSFRNILLRLKFNLH
jgi:nicotinic acetylcholine receptor